MEAQAWFGKIVYDVRTVVYGQGRITLKHFLAGGYEYSGMNSAYLVWVVIAQKSAIEPVCRTRYPKWAICEEDYRAYLLVS